MSPPPIAHRRRWLAGGAAVHLAGEFLRLNQGADLSHVPYRSATALTVDMVGGHMPRGFLDSANIGS